MGLSIKCADTERAVRKLAAATGESLTRAVHTATVDRLAALGQPFKSREERLDDVRKWLNEVDARRPAKQPTHEDVEAWMYDEDGLPR
jgi:antitoxin VapB